MFLFKLFTVSIAMVALLLIGVILLQEPKDRITPSGGGAIAIQRIGINPKADFLEKATWVLVGLLLGLTLLSTICLKHSLHISLSPNIAKAQQEAMKLDKERSNDTTLENSEKNNKEELEAASSKEIPSKETKDEADRA